MKYHKLVENAAKPKGFWGRMMIRSMNKNHAALTEWGLSHIEFERDYHVLDVGCGGGSTVEKLCSKIGNGKVFGIDYSQLCVKDSQTRNQKNIMCGKAKIMNASVSSLPFISDTFDVVTAVETYYFWPDKINDLKEIYRVIKPNGKILLVFEMLKSSDNPQKWERVEKTAKIKSVTQEEIQNILSEAGYIHVKTFVKKGTSWMCAVAQK